MKVMILMTAFLFGSISLPVKAGGDDERYLVPAPSLNAVEINDILTHILTLYGTIVTAVGAAEKASWSLAHSASWNPVENAPWNIVATWSGNGLSAWNLAQSAGGDTAKSFVSTLAGGAARDAVTRAARHASSLATVRASTASLSSFVRNAAWGAGLNAGQKEYKNKDAFVELTRASWTVVLVHQSEIERVVRQATKQEFPMGVELERVLTDLLEIDTDRFQQSAPEVQLFYQLSVKQILKLAKMDDEDISRQLAFLNANPRNTRDEYSSELSPDKIVLRWLQTRVNGATVRISRIQ